MIQTFFPQFHLEDKVSLVGKGIDGPRQQRPLKYYYRRRAKKVTSGNEFVMSGGN